MTNTLTQMAAIARQAADEIMKIYARPFEVDYKGPNDPVTEADRLANDLICRRLQEEFGDIPVVAEESPREDWDHYRDHERVFFVDPIDGTREFVAKNGYFCVMIGLLDGAHPTHGVVYAPATDTLWTGEVGVGAYKIGSDGRKAALLTPPSRCVRDARVACSVSQNTPLHQAALQRLSPKESVPIGSAGLKGVAVADGSVDIYLAPGSAGSRWDSCAPEAILRAVGCVLTDVHGRDFDYRATAVENVDGAVAAEQGLHAEVIDALSELFR